jgi:hypothetical protein
MDPDVGPGYFFKHPSLEMPFFCDLEPCIRENCGWVGNPAPKGWLKPYKQWDVHHLSTGARLRNHPLTMIQLTKMSNIFFYLNISYVYHIE